MDRLARLRIDINVVPDKKKGVVELATTIDCAFLTNSLEIEAGYHPQGRLAVVLHLQCCV
jgi:hypothetical protein